MVFIKMTDMLVQVRLISQKKAAATFGYWENAAILDADYWAAIGGKSSVQYLPTFLLTAFWFCTESSSDCVFEFAGKKPHSWNESQIFELIKL